MRGPPADGRRSAFWPTYSEKAAEGLKLSFPSQEQLPPSKRLLKSKSANPMEGEMASLMKSLAIAATTAVALSVTPVYAQPLPQQETVELTMEQRHVIKEIILKDLKIAPQTAEVPTQIGQPVPTGVPLQPIPVEVSAKIPQIKSHSFIVKNDTVLIIDPKDNKIAAKVE
jgi:hypothetical protein